MPPKSSAERTRPRRMIKSRRPRPPPVWNDDFARGAAIPEYQVYTDVHAQKFVTSRKKSTQGARFIDNNQKNVGGIKQQRLIYSNRPEYSHQGLASANPRYSSSRRPGGIPPRSNQNFSSNRPSNGPHDSLSVSSQKGGGTGNVNYQNFVGGGA